MLGQLATLMAGPTKVGNLRLNQDGCENKGGTVRQNLLASTILLSILVLSRLLKN
jgi:hypothetical protein